MAKHFVANTLGPHHRPRDPGARRARLLDRHAARPHVPARALGALRRRRRRGAPDAHRAADDRGLPEGRLDPQRDRRPADLTRSNERDEGAGPLLQRPIANDRASAMCPRRAHEPAARRAEDGAGENGAGRSNAREGARRGIDGGPASKSRDPDEPERRAEAHLSTGTPAACDGGTVIRCARGGGASRRAKSGRCGRRDAAAREEAELAVRREWARCRPRRHDVDRGLRHRPSPRHCSPRRRR